jgi:hypothetical protein
MLENTLNLSDTKIQFQCEMINKLYSIKTAYFTVWLTAVVDKGSRPEVDHATAMPA